MAAVGGDRQVVGIEPDAVSRADPPALEVERLPATRLDVAGIAARAFEDVEPVVGRPDRHGVAFELDVAVQFEPQVVGDAVEDDPVVPRAGHREQPAAIGERQPLGPLMAGRDPRHLRRACTAPGAARPVSPPARRGRPPRRPAPRRSRAPRRSSPPAASSAGGAGPSARSPRGSARGSCGAGRRAGRAAPIVTTVMAISSRLNGCARADEVDDREDQPAEERRDRDIAASPGARRRTRPRRTVRPGHRARAALRGWSRPPCRRGIAGRSGSCAPGSPPAPPAPASVGTPAPSTRLDQSGSPVGRQEALEQVEREDQDEEPEPQDPADVGRADVPRADRADVDPPDPRAIR